MVDGVEGLVVQLPLACLTGWAFTHSQQPNGESMDVIIYGICLALGLLFTIISAVAGHFFGGDGNGDIGTGGHAEAGFDTSGLPGISFFSPTVLSAFVTAFGACGLILSRIEATNSVWASAPLSAIIGGGIAWLVFLFFNAMFKKTQSSSESRVATLVGQTASIMTPIPENGVGEIGYVQSGSRYTAPARSQDGKPIPAGQPVRISRIVGSQFYVEPIK
jgi:membrane protein implicated in regulation of membrane protease activity